MVNNNILWHYFTRSLNFLISTVATLALAVYFLPRLTERVAGCRTRRSYHVVALQAFTLKIKLYITRF